MDTDSFIVYIKTEAHCLKQKIKKVIGLMKDELEGKIMTKFIGLRAESYSYLILDVSEDKKTKKAPKR